MTKPSAKTAKDSCGRLCREIVRLRGCCQRCLATQNLQWAHIRRRKYVGDPDGVSLFSNPENSWLLCGKCHQRVDSDAVAFTELVDQTIGREKYEEFVRLSHAPHRRWTASDWIAERERLKAMLEAAGKAKW